MRQMQRKGTSLLLALCMLFSLFGCGQPSATGGGNGGLDLDYIEGTGTADTGNGASEEEPWYAWVTDAFSFGEAKSNTIGSGNADGSDAPDSVREIYETPSDTPSGSANTNNDQRQTGDDDTAQAQTSAAPQDTASVAQDRGNERDNHNTEEDDNPQAPQTQTPGQTPEPVTPSTPSTGEQEQTPSATGKTVTMSIRCDTAVNNGMHLEPKWAGIVPASGVILDTTTFEIEDGDTALDVLIQARDKYKLHMEYSGSASSAYVEGINNLYEFDGGRWSGWMYAVNDWYPNYGCGQYFVKAGDVIEWNYTCDLGIDLDAGMEGAEEWKETHE